MPRDFIVVNNLRVALREIADLRRRLERAARTISYQAIRIVQKEVINEVRSQGLIASGDFLKSIKVENFGTPFSKGFRTDIYSDLPYADTIEGGRKPNSKFPPPDRIYRWMIRKGLEPSASAVYLISRKIARDGIPPKYPFARAIESSEGQVRVRAEIEISEALEGSRFGVEFR